MLDSAYNSPTGSVVFPPKETANSKHSITPVFKLMNKSDTREAVQGCETWLVFC